MAVEKLVEIGRAMLYARSQPILQALFLSPAPVRMLRRPLTAQRRAKLPPSPTMTNTQPLTAQRPATRLPRTPQTFAIKNWDPRRAYKMRRLRIACVFASLLAFSTSPRSRAEESRTWTDATGKFKIEATFVELQGVVVRLRQKDGRFLKLPLAKLSVADRRYVQEQVKARNSSTDNPFEKGLEKPEPAAPKAASSKQRGRSSEGGFREGDRVEVAHGADWRVGTVVAFDDDRIYVRMDDDGSVDSTFMGTSWIRKLRGPDPNAPGNPLAEFSEDYSISLADMSRVRRVVPQTEATEPFRPDPAPAAPPGKWRPRPVGLGAKRGFFEETIALCFCAAPSPRAVLISSGASSGRGGPSRVQICDLKTGRVGDGFSAPRNVKLADVSPSGKRLITASEVDMNEFGPVQAWTLHPDKLTHIVSWNPDAKSSNTGLTSLLWLDDDRVLTLSSRALTLWNIEGAQAVYQVDVDDPVTAVLSPGRSQVAVVQRDSVSVFSAGEGELLAFMKLDGVEILRQAAFSPTGRALAVSGREQVAIFDPATGQKITSVHSQVNARFRADLSWVNDDYVLNSGSELIHVPSQMVVWSFLHMADSVCQFGGRTWYMFDERHLDRRSLVPFDFLQLDATAFAEDDLVLKPGDSIAVETELMVDLANADDSNSDSAPSESVADLLKRFVRSAGYQVAADSPNTLVARMTPGETKEMQYSRFGMHNEVTPLSVQTRNYDLELKVGEQIVWNRTSVQSPPHHLQLQKNESIEQAVAREMLPSGNYFGTAIPSRVPKPELAKNRRSTISVNGISNDPADLVR